MCPASVTPGPQSLLGTHFHHRDRSDPQAAGFGIPKPSSGLGAGRRGPDFAGAPCRAPSCAGVGGWGREWGQGLGGSGSPALQAVSPSRAGLECSRVSASLVTSASPVPLAVLEEVEPHPKQFPLTQAPPTPGGFAYTPSSCPSPGTSLAGRTGSDCGGAC